MRRAAVEKAICIRRKRQAKSGAGLDSRPLGWYRKRDPWDCGNPQCCVCHCDKVFGRPRHCDMRRAGIDSRRGAKMAVMASNAVLGAF